MSTQKKTVKKGDTHSRGQKKANKKQQQAVAPELPPKKKVFIPRKPVFEVKQSVLYEGANEALGLATKKLLKKDANTKSKAITEIITILDELHTSDTSAIKDFLPFFANALEKLSLDEHVSVRLGLGAILRRIIIRDKQALATHMKDMIGPWMQLLCDPSSDVAAEFTACLEEAFPIKRRPVVLVHLASSLLRYILKFVSTTPEEMRPLLDLATPSDLEERYHHIVSSNLTAIAKLMTYLNTEQNAKLLEGVTNTDELLAEMASISYSDLFHENCVFQHASSHNLLLRNALVFVLEALVENLPSLANDCIEHIRTVITNQLHLADRSSYANTLKMTVTCVTKVPLLFEDMPFMMSAVNLFLVMFERFGDDCVEYFLPLVGNISAIHLSCHQLAAVEDSNETNEENAEEIGGEIPLFDMVVSTLERILKVESDGKQQIPPSLTAFNIAQLLQAIVFLLLRKPPTTEQQFVVNQDRVVRLLKVIQTSIMTLTSMLSTKTNAAQGQEQAEVLTLIGKSLALLHRASIQESCNMTTKQWNGMLWQSFATDHLLPFEEETDAVEQNKVKKVQRFVHFVTVSVHENTAMFADHLNSDNALGFVLTMIIRFVSALHLVKSLDIIEIIMKTSKTRILAEQLFEELVQHQAHLFIQKNDVSILEKVLHISSQLRQIPQPFFMQSEYLMMLLHSGSLRILTLLLAHLSTFITQDMKNNEEVMTLIERVAMSVFNGSEEGIEEEYAASIMTSSPEEKVEFLMQAVVFDTTIKSRLLSTIVTLWKETNFDKKNVNNVEVWFILSLLYHDLQAINTTATEASNKGASTEITQLLLQDEDMKFTDLLLQIWLDCNSSSGNHNSNKAASGAAICSWHDVQTRLLPVLSTEFVSSWCDDLKRMISAKSNILMISCDDAAMGQEVADCVLRYHHCFSQKQEDAFIESLPCFTPSCWLNLTAVVVAATAASESTPCAGPVMLVEALRQSDSSFVNQFFSSHPYLFLSIYNIILMTSKHHESLLSYLDAKVEHFTIPIVVLFVLQRMMTAAQEEDRINVDVAQRVLEHVNKLSSLGKELNVKKNDKTEEKATIRLPMLFDASQHKVGDHVAYLHYFTATDNQTQQIDLREAVIRGIHKENGPDQPYYTIFLIDSGRELQTEWWKALDASCLHSKHDLIVLDSSQGGGEEESSISLEELFPLPSNVEGNVTSAQLEARNLLLSSLTILSSNTKHTDNLTTTAIFKLKQLLGQSDLQIMPAHTVKFDLLAAYLRTIITRLFAVQHRGKNLTLVNLQLFQFMLKHRLLLGEGLWLPKVVFSVYQILLQKQTLLSFDVEFLCFQSQFFASCLEVVDSLVIERILEGKLVNKLLTTASTSIVQTAQVAMIKNLWRRQGERRLIVKQQQQQAVKLDATTEVVKKAEVKVEVGISTWEVEASRLIITRFLQLTESATTSELQHEEEEGSEVLAAIHNMFLGRSRQQLTQLIFTSETYQYFDYFLTLALTEATVMTQEQEKQRLIAAKLVDGILACDNLMQTRLASLQTTLQHSHEAEKEVEEEVNEERTIQQEKSTYLIVVGELMAQQLHSRFTTDMILSRAYLLDQANDNQDKDDEDDELLDQSQHEDTKDEDKNTTQSLAHSTSTTALRTSNNQSTKANKRIKQSLMSLHDPLGSVLLWLCLLQSIDTASHCQGGTGGSNKKIRAQCGLYLKRQEDLFSNIISFLLHLGNRDLPTKEQKTRLHQLLKNNAVFDVPTLWQRLQRPSLSQLAVYALYRTIITLPAMVRVSWTDDCTSRMEKSQLNRFVEEQVRPGLLQREMHLIELAKQQRRYDEKQLRIECTSLWRTGEITATLFKDETSVEMTIKLPQAYPLKNVDVTCTSKVGVTEGRWRRWVLQMIQLLSMQEEGGAVIDAVMLWKRNIDQELEGVEPCPICYSVLGVESHRLPSFSCPTCRNKFHPTCLHTWFKSSGKSKCVICQQPISL